MLVHKSAMLFLVLLWVAFAHPSRLRLLNDREVSTGELAESRRRLKLPIDDLDFIDEDDVGLNKGFEVSFHWDKPRSSHWKSHHSTTHSRRSRQHSLSETMVAGGFKDKLKSKMGHGKERRGEREEESNGGKAKKSSKNSKSRGKNDPESGDSILDKVKEKAAEKKQEGGKEGGGKNMSQKDKLERKIKGLEKRLRAKSKLCEEKKCTEDKEQTVECIQCDLSKSILTLNTQQHECELKCLVADDVKECREGCFKEKAKVLYKKMESYLEKKKDIMANKCEEKCKKTGEMGDVYTCWKCRMSEELTRVARCRHRCQHKVKGDQKTDCFPACLEAVEKNMRKLKDGDKERQAKAAKEKPKEKPKEKSQDSQEQASEERKKTKGSKDLNEGW